uniref:Uncharacterized protein n=1 Tax=Ascaris lumbricoides TaxID=6252 RepID=A0A0M3IAC5_ASCLU
MDFSRMHNSSVAFEIAQLYKCTAAIDLFSLANN